MTGSGNKDKKTKGIRLTTRDCQILEALHTTGYLTTHQIRLLFFTEGSREQQGSIKATERRMRLLYGAGLVRRIEQPVKRGEGSKPYIYALSKKGADLLIAELGIDPAEIQWRPHSFEGNYPFLNHLLATTDFQIALRAACKPLGIKVVLWTDERELRATRTIDYVMLTSPTGQPVKTAVIPDAIFVLERDGRRAVFFVEIDRRTVTVEPKLWERKGWTKKVYAYEAYMRTEEYTKRYEGRRARILTITTGEKRLENLKVATEKAEGSDIFWFATMADALDSTGLLSKPIWQVAGSEGQRSLLQ